MGILRWRPLASGLDAKVHLFTLLAVILLQSCALQAARLTAPSADALSSHLAAQPKPSWFAPLTTAEVEDAGFLSTNRLYVTTMEFTGMGQIWRAEKKDLLLIDTLTGKTLWTLPRGSLVKEVRAVHGNSARVYVEGSAPEGSGSTVAALNADTGAVLWQRTEPPGVTSQTAPSKIIMVLRRRARDGDLAKDGDVLLTGIDLVTGKDRWTRTITGNGRATVPWREHFMLDAGHLVVGSRADLVSLESGAVLWTIPLAGSSSPTTVMEADGRIAVLTGSTLHYIDARAGRELWQNALKAGEGVTPVLENGMVFVLMRSGQGHAVLRIDASGGSILWTAKVDGSLRSPLVAGREMVYYTTRDRVVGLDAGNGQVRWEGKLADPLRSPTGLPDHVLVMGDQVVVAREVGVASYHARTGKQLYTEPVHGARGFTHDFLNAKMMLRRAGAAGPGAQLAGLVPGITAASGQFAQQSSDIYLRMSQTNLDTVRMNTRSVLDSRTSTPNERMAALNAQESAIRSNHAIGVAAAQADLAAAILGLSMSMVNLGMQFRASWVEASFELAGIQENSSNVTHLRAIQQNYYVRPFYDNGWGVTLIRLADGHRADLYVSPANEPLSINAGNLPLFIIEPGSNWLIAKGLGLGLPGVPTYDRVAWPATPGGLFGLPDNWTIAYPSVLGYDLSRVSFRSGGGKPGPEWPELGERESRLRQAILTGDEKAVKDLLSQGADPNAEDRYGLNALFYAAVMDIKPIVKDLIEKGADGTRRDDHLWSPLHYSFMTKPGHRSGGLLMDALHKGKEAEHKAP